MARKSDGGEYLKYVTERIVTYWESPKTPEIRRERRQRREPWSTRWFGQLLPVGLGIWWIRRKLPTAHSIQDEPEQPLIDERQPDYL